MARTARSLHARKKRRKVLEQAKGYRGTKHSSYKRAKEQVWKSGVYAYQGRKQRKRDFRSLWIQRINAGAREHGMSYSQLIHGLRLAEIDLDRKILADLAATEPEIFAGIVTQARNALSGNPVETRVKVERAPEPEPAPRSKPRASRKPAAEAAPAAQAQPEPEAAPATEATDADEQPEVEATEAAERRAEELDVDIESIDEGSGAEGRVLVEDVEEAAEEEGKVHATDAAERKAEELGVDLSVVEGTGQEGRITVGDVEKAAKDGEDG
jgi:large subunit ribosomal protein L20